MIRYNYNQQIVPPAPLVHVTIRAPYQETAVSEAAWYSMGLNCVWKSNSPEESAPARVKPFKTMGKLLGVGAAAAAG